MYKLPKFSMCNIKGTLRRTFTRILPRSRQFAKPGLPAMRIILMQGELRMRLPTEDDVYKTVKDFLDREIIGACLVFLADQNRFTVEPSTIRRCAICGTLHPDDTGSEKNPQCPRCKNSLKNSVNRTQYDERKKKVFDSVIKKDNESDEIYNTNLKVALKKEFDNEFVWQNSHQYFASIAEGFQDNISEAMVEFINLINYPVKDPDSCKLRGWSLWPWGRTNEKRQGTRKDWILDGVSESNAECALWIKRNLDNFLSLFNEYAQKGKIEELIHEVDVAAKLYEMLPEEQKTGDDAPVNDAPGPV